MASISIYCRNNNNNSNNRNVLSAHFKNLNALTIDNNNNNSKLVITTIIKCDTDEADLICLGGEFNSLGAAKANALSP